jgi:predicted exporter
MMLALLLAAAAWQSRHGLPIATSLTDLLPQVAQPSAIQQRAEARIQEPLSRQIVALVGAADAPLALAQARALGQQWQDSGYFSTVRVELSAELADVRQQILHGRLALLPASVAHQLLTDPARYATQRASELASLFSSSGIVPVDQDWLGLGQAIAQTMAPVSAVQPDLASGTLQARRDGITWVLVTATTRGDAFDQSEQQGIGNVLATSRRHTTEAGAQVLMAGGPLYAAAGRDQAMAEMRWIGGASVLGIVLMLLLALRRVRVLLAFFPIGVGVLTGFVACVAVFGTIHALTLVIGASLIGVAVDFPLHWPVMRLVLPGITLSLATSLIGYLVLAFAPFPALQQTAVFSAAGLLGAYICTVCLLPAWFGDWQPRPQPALLRAASILLAAQARLARHPARGWLLGVLIAATLAGASQVSVQDDLRRWIKLPDALLQEAIQIADITGFMPTSQFFLVSAPDEQTLLQREATLTERLDPLVSQGTLGAYQALSQWLAPPARQTALRQQLATLAAAPQTWNALLALGIPAAAIQAELHAIAQLPTLDIDAALSGPLGERWRPLWLGMQEGQAASLVSLTHIRDTDRIAAAAHDLPGITYVDRTQVLNHTFSAARLQAAELKLLSYIGAAALLWLVLGRHAAWRILLVPFAASLFTLAALGGLGRPVTLFSLFGLLLVSAIGVDYAIFMYERVAGAAASLVGIVLAATTTVLSFGLLALSDTPAIADFGLSVALGIAFTVLVAPWTHIAPAFAASPSDRPLAAPGSSSAFLRD